jgi:formamidopyrimidine-DNA glycosylase
VIRVWTSGKPQTFKTPETEIAAALDGAVIESVRRVGKTIVMTARQDATAAEFLIHLGMTGRLLVSSAAAPMPPHTHAVLTLSDGREIRFVDPRRFGRLSIHRPDSSSAQPTGYSGPGREPPTISAEDFVGLFRNRKTPIKAALLNQSLLQGVGNIYADEALFRAGIRPRRLAGRLTRDELLRLRKALMAVMRRAIKLGGSSVSDYVDADGVRGFFQMEHKVYMRGGEPCLICGTPIRRIVLAGRGTHFCPSCQS